MNSCVLTGYKLISNCYGLCSCKMLFPIVPNKMKAMSISEYSMDSDFAMQN